MPIIGLLSWEGHVTGAKDTWLRLLLGAMCDKEHLERGRMRSNTQGWIGSYWNEIKWIALDWINLIQSIHNTTRAGKFYNNNQLKKKINY